MAQGDERSVLGIGGGPGRLGVGRVAGGVPGDAWAGDAAWAGASFMPGVDGPSSRLLINCSA